ncbi:MAG TPA: helix-turn-helix domain-containing protein [Ktedonobacteraceae bacterium]|jgi:transposase|nr:helix-turn-helix domain-containing protein [Ktedonobacteraceae bacterium]
MRSPIFVRPFSDEEQHQIQAGLHSKEAFVLLRCQILMASARGERAMSIAEHLGCDDQTVRNVIHHFNTDGLVVLHAKSSRPHQCHEAIADEDLPRLQALLHRGPRNCGKETSLWSLDLLAQVSFEHGLTRQLVTGETIRQAIGRLGLNWKRVKHRINSPDPLYQQKKTLVTD